MDLKIEVDVEFIENINKFQVEKSRERYGILNKNLEFGLEHIEDKYIKDDFEKLSFLIIQICNGHSFVDGNKRTSAHLVIHILYKNNFFLDLYKEELKTLFLDIAQNKYNKKSLSIYIKKNIIFFSKLIKKLKRNSDELEKINKKIGNLKKMI